MKKYFISIITIFTFAFYVFSQRMGWVGTIQTSDSSGVQPSGVIDNGLRNPLFKDGTYRGISADAYYGRVQVEVVVNRGFIADVKFLDHPHEQGTSLEINGRATPLLRTEAISAQSAQVDTISGATQTSRAFRESLASALAQAAL